jgi:hypothetical protein
MDSLRAIGSALPLRQTRAPQGADPGSSLFAADGLSEPFESLPVEVLDPAHRADAERQKEMTDHFLSHVDASCFISLLQTMDPMPYDYQARAEYRRYYRQLHESLETPVLKQEP